MVTYLFLLLFVLSSLVFACLYVVKCSELKTERIHNKNLTDSSEYLSKEYKKECAITQSIREDYAKLEKNFSDLNFDYEKLSIEHESLKSSYQEVYEQNEINKKKLSRKGCHKK